MDFNSALQLQIQIVQVSVGVLAAGITAFAVYMRLFVSRELWKTQNEIVERVRGEFVTKETLLARIDMLEFRIRSLEIATRMSAQAAPGIAQAP